MNFSHFRELFFEVYAPILTIVSVEVHDNDGDQNGVLNNGETADIEVTVRNSGRQLVINLVGTLSSNDQYTRNETVFGF